MKSIYFGQVPRKEYEDGVKAGFQYLIYDEKAFDFVLRVTEYEVAVVDAVGRRVPISHKHILDLYKALEEVLPLSNVVNEYNERVETLEGETCV